MRKKDKYDEDLFLIEMLYKTEEFNSINEEIIKDSFKTMLTLIKHQNEKINQLDSELYSKVNREEFNEYLKNKVDYLVMNEKIKEEINPYAKYTKRDIVSKQELLVNNQNKLKNNNELGKEKEMCENNEQSLFTNLIYIQSMNNLYKDLNNLKLQFSMLSKNINTLMSSIKTENKEFFFLNSTDELELKNKVLKNDKDLTELIINVQNKFIKYEDILNNLSINQLNKEDIFEEIQKKVKKTQNDTIKYIEKQYNEIKKFINHQITDTIIDLIPDNKLNKNKENLNKSNIELIINDLKMKYNNINESFNVLNNKYQDKRINENIENINIKIEEIKRILNNFQEETKNKFSIIRKTNIPKSELEEFIAEFWEKINLKIMKKR